MTISGAKRFPITVAPCSPISSWTLQTKVIFLSIDFLTSLSTNLRSIAHPKRSSIARPQRYLPWRTKESFWNVIGSRSLTPRASVSSRLRVHKSIWSSCHGITFFIWDRSIIKWGGTIPITPRTGPDWVWTITGRLGRRRSSIPPIFRNRRQPFSSMWVTTKPSSSICAISRIWGSPAPMVPKRLPKESVSNCNLSPRLSRIASRTGASNPEIPEAASNHCISSNMLRIPPWSSYALALGIISAFGSLSLSANPCWKTNKQKSSEGFWIHAVYGPSSLEDISGKSDGSKSKDILLDEISEEY